MLVPRVISTLAPEHRGSSHGGGGGGPGPAYCGSKDKAQPKALTCFPQMVVPLNALDTKINVLTQHPWATSDPKTQYDQHSSSSSTQMQAAFLNLTSQIRNWGREGRGQVMPGTRSQNGVRGKATHHSATSQTSSSASFLLPSSPPYLF